MTVQRYEEFVNCHSFYVSLAIPNVSFVLFVLKWCITILYKTNIDYDVEDLLTSVECIQKKECGMNHSPRTPFNGCWYSSE